jgi:hypothetical protein
MSRWSLGSMCLKTTESLITEEYALGTKRCIFYSFARPFYTDSTREQDRDITGWTEIE